MPPVPRAKAPTAAGSKGGAGWAACTSVRRARKKTVVLLLISKKNQQYKNTFQASIFTWGTPIFSYFFFHFIFKLPDLAIHCDCGGEKQQSLGNF